MAYAFRDTISWLYLYNGSTAKSPKPKAEYLELYDKIMGKIQDFKNVEYLKIEVVVTKQEEEEILQCKLESYLSAAKFASLRTVIYIPHRTTSKNYRQAEGIVTTDEEQRLSRIKPTPWVKVFYADNISLNDKSVRYLMHKFPRLEDLTLNDSEGIRNDSGDGEDNGDNGRTTQRQKEQACKLNHMLMMQFFQYSVKMRSFYIHYCFPDDKIVNVVNRFVHFAADSTDKQLVPSINYSTRRTMESYPNMRIFQACYADDKKMNCTCFISIMIREDLLLILHYYPILKYWMLLGPKSATLLLMVEKQDNNVKKVISLSILIFLDKMLICLLKNLLSKVLQWVIALNT